MEEQEPLDEKTRKGIYLLPNLFTTGALFAGFYAVVAGMKGIFDHAAIAVFVAMAMDSLDGRVARLTNTQSAFGAEYDSLSDMLSFGIAPALVIYSMALNTLGKIGWLAAFVYTACTALRLARFNTQLGVSDKRYFQGLPSPAAAAMLSSTVWLLHEYHLDAIDFRWPLLVLCLFAACLMVSSFPYFSFKQFDPRGKVPFFVAIVIVLLFVCISIDPPQILFGMLFVYLLSGPFVALRQRRHRI